MLISYYICMFIDIQNVQIGGFWPSVRVISKQSRLHLARNMQAYFFSLALSVTWSEQFSESVARVKLCALRNRQCPRTNTWAGFGVKLQMEFEAVVFIILHPSGPDFDDLSCFRYFERWRKFPDVRVLTFINYSHYATRRKNPPS